MGTAQDGVAPPIKILLVDDHILFRQGLAALMRDEPDLNVVATAGTVRETVALARSLQPDVILMDFTLPDGTGLHATQSILAVRPETHIVFLTMHEEDETLLAAIRIGAKGYMLKSTPLADLLASIRGVMRGEASVTPALASRILVEFVRTGHPPAPGRAPEMEELTARELEVLEILSQGATNREIARKLVITESTVKNHVHNILAKLRLKNRRQLARYGRQ